VNKYHAIPTTIDGIRFDSKREAERFQELTLLQKAGEIGGLVCHPHFVVWEGKDKQGKVQHVDYKGDFQYEENCHVVVEDVKGVRTAVFSIKAKMFRCMYPQIDFRVIS